MTSKTSLLKELGWDKELIKHFMVDDFVEPDDQDPELQTEVYETSSMRYIYNSNAEVIMQIK